MTKQPFSSCPMMTAWRDNPTVSGDPLWHRFGFLIGWPRHGFFAVDICSARLPRTGETWLRRYSNYGGGGGTVLLLYSNNRARGLPPHMTLHRTPAGVLLGTCSCVLTPGLGAVQVIGYVVLLYCMWGHVLVGGEEDGKGPSLEPRVRAPMGQWQIL